MTTGIVQDVRGALRQFWRAPGFTATAVLSLMLGIGATTAIFSVVYGVLLDPYPYKDADRMVHVELRDKSDRGPLLDQVLRQYLGPEHIVFVKILDAIEHLDTQAQVIEQGFHDRRVAGIANGAIVEVAHLTVQSFTQSAEATRRIERLIGHAIEGKRLEFFERAGLPGEAVHNGFSRFAIFVDHPIGGPRKVVVQRVGRIFRQRPDAQAHVVKRVEMAG